MGNDLALEHFKTDGGGSRLAVSKDQLFGQVIIYDNYQSFVSVYFLFTYSFLMT